MKSLQLTFQVIGFVNGLISGLIMPVLFVYLSNQGASSFEIAMLAFISTVTTMVFGLPGGNFADTNGRKRTYLLAQIPFLLFCVGITFTRGFVGLATSMFLAGLATAIASGTLESIFVQKYSESEHQLSLQTQLAKQSLFTLAGSLIGVLIGILLGTMSGNVSGHFFLAAQNDVFLIGAGLTLALMIFIYFNVDEIQPERSKSTIHGRMTELRSAFKQSLGAFAANKQLVVIISSSTIAAAGYMSFEKFWQLKVNDLANDPKSRMVFYLFYLGGIIISIIGQQFSVKLCSYFKGNLVYPVIVARIALIVAFVCMYFSHNIVGFAFCYVLIFLATATSASPSTALLHKHITNDVRTSLLSIRSIAVQAGAAVGIIIAGLASHYFSVDVAFLASACLYLLSTAVYYMNIKVLNSNGGEIEPERS